MRNSRSKEEISASRKETEKDLDLQKNLNERVLNSVSDNILLIDLKNYRIISANEATPDNDVAGQRINH
jgi:hypothetical protein